MRCFFLFHQFADALAVWYSLVVLVLLADWPYTCRGLLVLGLLAVVTIVVEVEEVIRVGISSSSSSSVIPDLVLKPEPLLAQ